TTDHTQELPPGTATGMAIGAEIPPSRPTLVGTVRVRAAMVRGVDLTAASACHDDAWGRSGGGLRAGVGWMLRGVVRRLRGEACKGGGLTLALGQWGCGLRCRRTHGGVVAGPRPLEHEAQPHQGDEYQLVKKEMGDHGKIPS